MTNRKFFKKTITIEVLSEDSPFDFTSLESLGWAMTSGEFSGSVVNEKDEELNGKQAADELLAQGSDPEFFSIDEEGEDIS